MLTSAVLVQTTVQQRQHVQTLMAATLVPVTLDTLEMVSLAMVSYTIILSVKSCSGIVIVIHHNILFIDINECEVGTDSCDENAECTNTDGSYTCACNTGFIENGVTCNGMYNYPSIIYNYSVPV